MRKILQKLIPRKNHFMGIDIGTHQIKAAEVQVIDGIPEVVSLRSYPSPPGVWTEEFDEESLIQALKAIANPQLKEVITCIGGEKVISRILRLPQMSRKELEAAARFEIEKFVPIPVDQLIIRYIQLEKEPGNQEKPLKRGRFSSRAGKTPEEATETRGNQEEGQSVLLLAVPAATVYQYHSIFSRAGLVVTAVDLQAFALWRLFGQAARGTLAIADIGAKTSHLVIVKEGLIQFVRLLPVGGDALTNSLINTYGVEPPEAEQMKEEAAISMDGDQDSPGVMQMGEILREGLLEIIKELRRSLDFYSTYEKLWVERLILSGGTSKLKGLTGYLQDALNIQVETGVPEIGFSTRVTFDPAFSIAVGLALREVTQENV